MVTAPDSGHTRPPLWLNAMLLWGAIALVAISVLWTGAFLKSRADQDAEREIGRQKVIELANSYARQLHDSMEQIDQLSLLIAHLPQSQKKVDMQQVFQDLPSYSWFNPLLIDSEGIVFSSRTASLLGFSLVNTDFFQRHKNSDATGLQINPPGPGYGLLEGKKVIRFSRRINDPQGRFAGVVSLSVLQDQLTYFGGDVALNSGDVIAIKYREGDTLTQRVIGTDIQRDDLPSHSNNTGSTKTFTEIRLPGDLMYVGRQPIETYPLQALIAISERNILNSYAATRELHQLLQYAATGLIIFLCLSGGWLQSRRDTRAFYKNQISNTFRLAVDASREELYMISPFFDKAQGITDFIIEDCNGQAARMSDIERGELVGKSLNQIISGANLAATKLFLHSAMNDGLAEKEIFIYRDGPKKKCWMQARAVRADLGLAVTLQDITEVKEKEQQLEQLALTDALTHLPNRHWMNQQLPFMLQTAENQGYQFAALFIDLDNFKTINDTLGHKAGDAFLQEVARVLQQSVRKQDHVLRLGGDEFMILLHELSSPEIALEIAGHLLTRLREIDLHSGGNSLSTRASIGVAFYPDHATTPEGLVQAADIAMYEAKRSGKDRVAQYSTQMLDQLSERMNMQSALQHAIPDGQLLLYMQPRASATSGHLVGFEALVRWQHPELGLVSPERFIPLAEESHLIVELGNWVAATACETLALWRDMGKKIVPVSINVSARQLKDSEFRMQLQQHMQTHRIKSSDIAIELTESMMIGENDTVRQELMQLDEMGLELMIDDFGTGYSSLARLHRLQVDVLKIDQSFVRNLSAGGDGIVLCQAMTQMGKTLGLTVVAEGVETTEQLQLLQRMGCDEIQGYIASPPVPLEAALKMLEGPPFFAPMDDMHRLSETSHHLAELS